MDPGSFKTTAKHLSTELQSHKYACCENWFLYLAADLGPVLVNTCFKSKVCRGTRTWVFSNCAATFEQPQRGVRWLLIKNPREVFAFFTIHWYFDEWKAFVSDRNASLDKDKKSERKRNKRQKRTRTTKMKKDAEAKKMEGFAKLFFARSFKNVWPIFLRVHLAACYGIKTDRYLWIKKTNVDQCHQILSPTG